MKITKKQIVQLDKGETTVRELFPQVFETKLEVGKWYKYQNCLAFILELEEEDDFIAYGFLGKKWYDKCSHWTNGFFGWKLATKEEVETALINEAKRRGFKVGSKFKNIVKSDLGRTCEIITSKFRFDYHRNTLDDPRGYGLIFDNGVWAEIIQPKQMTKEEIEKELGYEIEIKS